jgi:hypothetical protein
VSLQSETKFWPQASACITNLKRTRLHLVSKLSPVIPFCVGAVNELPLRRFRTILFDGVTE